MEEWSLHKKHEVVNNGESREEDVWSTMKAREANAKCKVGGVDEGLAKRSSAPINIPDWSKVYGKIIVSGSENVDYDNCNDDDEEDEGVKVPPHEWLARKLARSQISSFSVCEGVGRTLKGRELSRVRNAILTKTGFLE